MKLEKLYKKAIETGIKNDLRGKEEIKKTLAEEKEKHKKLKDDEVEYYDKDKLFNPFSDTRVLNGDLNTNVKK